MTGEQTTFASLAELIGKEGALTLCENYGGETLYIRKSISLDDGPRHHWAELFGQTAWERLNKRLSGRRVYVPAAPPELLAERNAAIVARLNGGEAIATIASDFKLTQRRVYAILQSHTESEGGES